MIRKKKDLKTKMSWSNCSLVVERWNENPFGIKLLFSFFFVASINQDLRRMYRGSYSSVTDKILKRTHYLQSLDLLTSVCLWFSSNKKGFHLKFSTVKKTSVRKGFSRESVDTT